MPGYCARCHLSRSSGQPTSGEPHALLACVILPQYGYGLLNYMIGSYAVQSQRVWRARWLAGDQVYTSSHHHYARKCRIDCHDVWPFAACYAWPWLNSLVRCIRLTCQLAVKLLMAWPRAQLATSLLLVGWAIMPCLLVHACCWCFRSLLTHQPSYACV